MGQLQLQFQQPVIYVIFFDWRVTYLRRMPPPCLVINNRKAVMFRDSISLFSMKHIKILLPLLFFHFSVIAQVQSDKTYFVVIGSFKIQDNAIRFTADANHNGFTAQYAICPSLGLYFVYVLETNDHIKAQELSVKMKEEPYLKDTWVYTGKLGGENNSMTASEVRAAHVNETQIKLNNGPAPEKKSEAVYSSTKKIYFRVISRFDDKEIIGTLLLKEPGEKSCFQSVKSGEVVFLNEPKGKKKSYDIIALMPGYKQSSIVFFYASPPIETGPNNEDIITLTMEKAKSPEFIEFNHVHFYRNTSTLRPISLNELDELANLLKENPKNKIVIHGYGKSNQDQEPYRTDNGTRPKENTSPKDLALARAETVKAHLVLNGIEPSSIQTIGEENEDKNHDGIEIEFVKNVTQSLSSK